MIHENVRSPHVERPCFSANMHGCNRIRTPYPHYITFLLPSRHLIQVYLHKKTTKLKNDRVNCSTFIWWRDINSGVMQFWETAKFALIMPQVHSWWKWLQLRGLHLWIKESLSAGRLRADRHTQFTPYVYFQHSSFVYRPTFKFFNNPQILQLRFLPLQKRPKIFKGNFVSQFTCSTCSLRS